MFLIGLPPLSICRAMKEILLFPRQKLQVCNRNRHNPKQTATFPGWFLLYEFGRECQGILPFYPYTNE
jgi:hypothetical protein